MKGSNSLDSIEKQLLRKGLRLGDLDDDLLIVNPFWKEGLRGLDGLLAQFEREYGETLQKIALMWKEHQKSDNPKIRIAEDTVDMDEYLLGHWFYHNHNDQVDFVDHSNNMLAVQKIVALMLQWEDPSAEAILADTGLSLDEALDLFSCEAINKELEAFEANQLSTDDDKQGTDDWVVLFRSNDDTFVLVDVRFTH